MEPIDLNDLPLWSQWPARLLGLAAWTIPSRTLDKVRQEYDSDKYAKCLSYYLQTGNTLTPEQIRAFQQDNDLERKICIYLGDDLYETTLQEASAQFSNVISETMRAEIMQCRTIVELGCGYGFNLWYLNNHFRDSPYLGGEYSENAERLAGYLFQDYSNIRIRHFDFYDPETYRFLDEIEPPVLVFTCHAIEQLPYAQFVVDYLFPYRQKIKTVIHFEPFYELYGDDNLLGLLRRRYTEMNDYNRDLFIALQNRPYVRVLHTEASVIGINPLNPTGIVKWEYCKDVC